MQSKSVNAREPLTENGRPAKVKAHGATNTNTSTQANTEPTTVMEVRSAGAETPNAAWVPFMQNGGGARELACLIQAELQIAHKNGTAE